MGKDEAINIMKNSELIKKVEHRKKIKNLVSLLIYKRWIITVFVIKKIEKDC